jgi:hypothetical protein
MQTAQFDPRLALTTLEGHGVRFVVIGGVGARLRGSPSITQDLDVCYDRAPENLKALAAALRELNARLRGVKEDVPFRLDERTLRAGDTFTFETDAGALDILGTPSGTGGYGDLEGDATEMDLGGVRVKVASVDALIRMKRAAGRLKDRIELEVLEALKDEIEQQPEAGS